MWEADEKPMGGGGGKKYYKRGPCTKLAKKLTLKFGGYGSREAGKKEKKNQRLAQAYYVRGKREGGRIAGVTPKSLERGFGVWEGGTSSQSQKGGGRGEDV